MSRGGLSGGADGGSGDALSRPLLAGEEDGGYHRRRDHGMEAGMGEDPNEEKLEIKDHIRGMQENYLRRLSTTQAIDCADGEAAGASASEEYERLRRRGFTNDDDEDDDEDAQGAQGEHGPRGFRGLQGIGTLRRHDRYEEDGDEDGGDLPRVDSFASVFSLQSSSSFLVKASTNVASRVKEEAKSFWSRRARRRMRSSIALFIIQVAASIVWSCCAASYYVWRLGWTFTSALYFTIQAGFGVGFAGRMVFHDGEHMDLDVLYFTVFVVIFLGSMSVFSFFAFFMNEFRLHAFTSLRKLESKMDEKEEPTWNTLMRKRSAKRTKGQRMVACLGKSFHWVCGGWISSFFGFKLPPVMYGFIVLVLVLTAGILLGTLNQHLNFHESVFFAITTAQSSGMVSPITNRRSEIACMIYVFIGVPAYAAFMSLLLERLTRPYTKLLQKKMLRRGGHLAELEQRKYLQRIRESHLAINAEDRSGVERDAMAIEKTLGRPSLVLTKNPQAQVMGSQEHETSLLLPTSPLASHEPGDMQGDISASAPHASELAMAASDRQMFQFPRTVVDMAANVNKSRNLRQRCATMANPMSTMGLRQDILHCNVKQNARTPSGLTWTEFLEVELMRLDLLEMDTLQAMWESFCVQSCLNKKQEK